MKFNKYKNKTNLCLIIFSLLIIASCSKTVMKAPEVLIHSSALYSIPSNIDVINSIIPELDTDRSQGGSIFDGSGSLGYGNYEFNAAGTTIKYDMDYLKAKKSTFCVKEVWEIEEMNGVKSNVQKFRLKGNAVMFTIPEDTYNELKEKGKVVLPYENSDGTPRYELLGTGNYPEYNGICVTVHIGIGNRVSINFTGTKSYIKLPNIGGSGASVNFDFNSNSGSYSTKNYGINIDTADTGTLNDKDSLNAYIKEINKFYTDLSSDNNDDNDDNDDKKVDITLQVLGINFEDYKKFDETGILNKKVTKDNLEEYQEAYNEAFGKAKTFLSKLVVDFWRRLYYLIPG